MYRHTLHIKKNLTYNVNPTIGMLRTGIYIPVYIHRGRFDSKGLHKCMQHAPI